MTDTYPSPAILGSRRLLGANWYADEAGALLEVRVTDEAARAALARWPETVRRFTQALGWTTGTLVVREVGAAEAHAFLSAPRDGLMTATTVAEQAWVVAEQASAVDELAVIAALQQTYGEECQRLAPAVRLVTAAQARGFSARLDDEQVSIGSGRGAHSWPVADAPPVDTVAWSAVADVPTALVTGSNGKTTTTRLIAAMLRAAGQVVGWSSSDGAFVEGRDGRATLEPGDMTGPSGARQVLADTRVTAAVLETARGGLLRRGLVANRADVAVITNISLDHLGDYGVRTLQDLAEVKGTVAFALSNEGRLILNADDETLRALATSGRLPAEVPIVWFSQDGSSPLVQTGVEHYGEGAVAIDGHLLVAHDGVWGDVGRLRDMPITFEGGAGHNVANLLASALTAAVLRAPLTALHQVAHTFGVDPLDNAGRLYRQQVGGVTVVTDYAHNPAGLRALLQTIREWPAARRLLVLGQAGDRDDHQLTELARAALDGPPFDCIIVKEMVHALRGRAPGEVSRVLTTALRAVGGAGLDIRQAPSEWDAVRDALAWARPGDLLVLPTHISKHEVRALLSTLQDTGWSAGEPLPP
jgi:UDP-N-acetylmuramyl tripeptide synthase